MTELARALDVVGPKWTLLIVQELLAGARRFTEIERALGDANPKMVTARLRELEAAGLVSRRTYAEVPPRVEYALTARGRALRPAIDALRRFGSRTSASRSRG
jgi:DNA-binding HxlR family transcriptional regulator